MEGSLNGVKCFFAAANSGYGFYSFYDDIFEDGGITDRYIIKGGPGTGKSRFMKELAYNARGKGMSVVTYSCSSDPSSLDGVIIDKGNGERMCVLDGTAPHICEASLPGARDTILNFCEFWDAELLKLQKESIIELNLKKSRAYHSASDCLRSALLVRREYDKAALNATDRDRIASLVKKYVSSSQRSEKYCEQIGIATSFGMFGKYTLNTYRTLVKNVFVIDNSYGNACVFLDCLLSYARTGGISTCRSYNFLDPHVLDAVCLTDIGASFISSDLWADERESYEVKQISMQRFTDKSERTALKAYRKRVDAVSKEIYKKALFDMQKMHAAHFDLERIYSSSMDFSKKEAFTDEWIAKNL